VTLFRSRAYKKIFFTR